MQGEVLCNIAYEECSGRTEGKGEGAAKEEGLGTGGFGPGDRC